MSVANRIKDASIADLVVALQISGRRQRNSYEDLAKSRKEPEAVNARLEQEAAELRKEKVIAAMNVFFHAEETSRLEDQLNLSEGEVARLSLENVVLRDQVSKLEKEQDVNKDPAILDRYKKKVWALLNEA